MHLSNQIYDVIFLNVLFVLFQALHAHSQFCISGDHTLEAAKHAVEEIAKQEDVDERFVIVLSDANLERYGIRPKKLAEILTANEDVNGFVIFIGSLGDQAHRYIICCSNSCS